MNNESLDDRYHLVRLIGSGGMGRVYEGVDAATGGRVAIKMIHDSAGVYGSGAPMSFSRLKREGRALRTIDTPHIVSVLNAGTHPGTGAPYIVLELLEGEDLQRTIDRIGPLPPPFALKIVAQACLGLKAAHAVGVVHRDIKPANLFLERQRGEIIVKILDFGLAKILRGAASAEPSSTLTDSSAVLGSPYYMSPEQLQNAERSDHRTDIWSIGAVLYCALTGRAPHEEIRSFVRLIAAICCQRSLSVRQIAPWVSPEAARIVEDAMEIDPSQRFPSALAMHDALRALLPDGFALRGEELSTLPCPSSWRAAG
jgi:eukaryotic-like serine/threonine-protein kinase